MIYPRDGSSEDKHLHELITSVSVSTIESDDVDATNVHLGSNFPKGMLVAMTNGKSFHFYDWRLVQNEIDKALKR